MHTCMNNLKEKTLWFCVYSYTYSVCVWGVGVGEWGGVGNFESVDATQSVKMKLS